MTKDEKQLIRILNRHVERNQRKAKIQDKSPEIEDASIDVQPKLHISCSTNILGNQYNTPTISSTKPIVNGIVDYDLDVKYNATINKIRSPYIVLNSSLDIPSIDLDVESFKFDKLLAEALVIVVAHEFDNYKKLKTLLDGNEAFIIHYMRHYCESNDAVSISFYGRISFIGFNDKNKLCFKLKGSLIK